MRRVLVLALLLGAAAPCARAQKAAAVPARPAAIGPTPALLALIPQPALAARLAQVNALAAVYAELVDVPHSVPRARHAATQQLVAEAAQLAAEGVTLWDRLWVGDGTGAAFYATPGGLVAVSLQPGGGARRLEGAASERSILAQMKGPGTFIPVSQTGNRFEFFPNRLFTQEGVVVDRLRRAGSRGSTTAAIKRALLAAAPATLVEGEARFAPEHEGFLAGLLELALPEDPGRQLELRRYARARLYQDAARDFLRREKTTIARVLADPRLARWASTLAGVFFQAGGHSETMTAETLLLAAMQRRTQGAAPFPGGAEFHRTLDEVERAVGPIDIEPPSAPDAPASHAGSGGLAELAARAARDVRGRSSRFQRGAARLAEALRILPRREGPGASGDALDVVERLYRQAGVENAGGFSNERRYRYAPQRLVAGTGYMPDGAPFAPLGASAAAGESAAEALRRVFSGNARFEDMENKLIAARPAFKALLQRDDLAAFPGLGARLSFYISRENLMRETQHGSAPDSAGRFFADYGAWEETAWNRLIVDFARGVELQVLRRRSPARFLLRLVSNWRPEDFSAVSDADFERAIQETLAIGRIRAKAFENVPRAWSEYRFKDLKDRAKKLVFSRLPKTKFLRNRFTWHSYFGIGWDCLCWTRESLFRVSFKK